MSADRADKPSRTVHFDTGMAMTLSCSPPRDGSAAPAKPMPSAAESQQRGTVK